MPIKKNQPKPTRIPGILQDGPNRFLVCARWTDEKTGQRRKRESVATSLAEAVALKESLKVELSPRKTTRIRFKDYAERWIELHASELQRSTQLRYAGELGHLMMAFGTYYVDGIGIDDIRVWRSRFAKNHAPATANSVLRTFRVCLDDAVTDGMLSVNPARHIKALKEGRTRGRRGTSLSPMEFQRFLNVVENLKNEKRIAEDIARLILTAAWTGMRRGELLALKWCDYVDGELRIERSVFNRVEKSTKTDDPRRITVTEPLREILDEQLQWLMRMQHPGLISGLVFPANPNQARIGALQRDTDQISWYRSITVMNGPLRLIAKEGNLPEISPHSFRRTWENLLREAGVDSLVRRAIAGWRTDKAQEIYATVDRRERDAASNAVAKLVLCRGSKS